MSSDENVRIAFCWYEPSEWEILKRTAVDAETLDDTYEEWKSNANNAIGEIQSQGLKIKKISIKMHELELWCQNNAYVNNAEARSEYAANKLQNRARKT